MSPADVPASVPRRRSRAIGAVIATISLGAAVWVVAANRDDLSRAIDSASTAPWTLVLAALLLPLINWLFTTISFWSLTRRFGPCGFGEMGALMGASWLANFLPLKPGLVGRVAYHARYHGVSVVESGRVLACVVACGVVATVALIALARFMAGSSHSLWFAWSSLAIVGVFACLAALILARAEPAASDPTSRRSISVGSVTVTLIAKFADGFAWVMRYMLAFEIVGAPLTLSQATAVAAVSQAVAALPIVGGALGIREWAVGAVSAVLPRSTGDSIAALPATADTSWAASLTGGILADLVNRAIELLLAIPVGLACGAWLARRTVRGIHGPTELSASPDIP